MYTGMTLSYVCYAAQTRRLKTNIVRYSDQHGIKIILRLYTVAPCCGIVQSWNGNLVGFTGPNSTTGVF